MWQTLVDTTAEKKQKFGSYYRIITERPKNFEEDDRFYRLAVKILKYCYYAVGGIYVTKDVSKTARYTLYTFNATVVTFIICSGQLYYLYGILRGFIKFDLLEYFLMTGPTGAYLHHFVMIPLLVIFIGGGLETTLSYITDFRTNLRKLNLQLGNETPSFLYEFDDELDGPMSYSRSVLQKKNNFVRRAIIMYLTNLFFSTLYVSGPPIHYLLYAKDDEMPEIRDSLILIPFSASIKSRQLYIVVLLVITLLSDMTNFFSILYSPLTELMGGIMYDHAVDINVKICIISENFVKKYEEIAMDDKRIDSKEALSTNLLIAAFEKDLSTLIIEYKKNVDAFQAIHLFVNVWTTVSVTMASVVSFVNVAIILFTVNSSAFQLYNALLEGVMLVFAMFRVCVYGRTYNDTGDLFREVAYNIPWYYLPPKTRKLVNLFQVSLFQGMECKILTLYPLNMAMFPRFWNSVFSYANILRASRRA